MSEQHASKQKETQQGSWTITEEERRELLEEFNKLIAVLEDYEKAVNQYEKSVA